MISPLFFSHFQVIDHKDSILVAYELSKLWEAFLCYSTSQIRQWERAVDNDLNLFVSLLEFCRIIISEHPDWLGIVGSLVDVLEGEVLFDLALMECYFMPSESGRCFKLLFVSGAILWFLRRLFYNTGSFSLKDISSWEVVFLAWIVTCNSFLSS